jgi:peptidyl-prolyl cis-trans isomerase D
MLKLMRSRFKQLKWILVVVIVLFVLLVFVDWGAGGAGTGGGAPQAFAARVNGETVSIRDYGRALYTTEKSYEQLYGQTLNDEVRRLLGMREMVMNQLVEETLLLQQAEKLNLTATAEEVRQEILRIPVLNPGGTFVGAELYSRYVTAQLGYPTSADFEDALARSLTLQKMQNLLANSVIIPASVAQEEFRRRNESATIRYVLLASSRLESEASVTAAEVEAFYQANQSRYAHPEQRRVKYLVADLGRLRAQIEPTEAELRAQYQSASGQYRTEEGVRAQHILIPSDPTASAEADIAARAEAEGLLARARGGESFDELARAHSQDPGSAASGGDLGFFPRGRMVPEFEQAAFALEPGEISDVVKTQFGYHIIRLNEKQAAGTQPFEQVRAQIEQQLVEERAKTQARERIAATRVRISQGNLANNEEALRGLSDDVVSYDDTQWFAQSDPIPGIGRNQQITSWAFSSRKGDLGPVIDTMRGPVIPILFDARPAGVAQLSEIRPRVETDARAAKATQLATERLRQVAAGGGSIDRVGSELGIVPVEVAVSGQGVAPGLGANAPSLAKAAMSAQPGQLVGPFSVDDGAVAFEVVSQKRVTPEEFEQQKSEFLEQMRQTEAVKLRRSLLTKLRNESKIDVNAQLLEYELVP